MKIFKAIKALCIFVIIGVVMTSLSVASFAENSNKILADWHFDESSVKSGELKKNNLVIKDSSGNGNDLEFNGTNGGKYFSFSNDRMYDGTSGSLDFNNPTYSFLSGGANFITSKNAKINKEEFKDGYTIEFVYQLPADFANNDSWMGLLGRKGKSKTMTDKSGVTMCLSVSNCKELQYLTANAKDNHTMDSAWSVSMDKGGVWYHIAVTSDNKIVRTFINGCEAFRDYASSEMVGMYADPNDGRFVIGGFDNGFLEHFGRGKYQQVRISSGALEKSDWLIPNPETVVGEYGINQEFTITSGGNYNIVFLPDIQNSIEFKTSVVDTSVKWLISNKDKANIVSIMSLGDNINTFDDQSQWNSAKKVIGQIADSNIPFIPMPGNHDYGDNYYLNSFGKTTEIGKKLVNNSVKYSPSGYSSYRTFEAGSYQYLMIAYSMFHIEDKMENQWLETVLSEHKNLPTIFASHDMQNCDAASPSKVHLSENGKVLWEKLKNHNQVFMMVGGHSHGAGQEILKNNFGNSVISVLADYQFAYNGGNGFFKFAEFDEAHKKIVLSTFSPYASLLPENQRTFFDVNYMTGAGNFSVFDIDFEKRFSGFTESSNSDVQKQINQIVKDLDVLKNGVTATDLDKITKIENSVNALPANMQSTFPNFKLIAIAKEIATNLLASGNNETVVPVFDEFVSQLEETKEDTATTKSSRTSLELLDVIMIITGVAIAILIAIVGTIAIIIVRKKKRKKN